MPLFQQSPFEIFICSFRLNFDLLLIFMSFFSLFYRVGTGYAMDFPALFSLVHILTARWQHCFAPKLIKGS
jgi:hypothetical protein